jgi:hypothetical protein
MKTAVYYVDVYANCLSDDVRNRELAVLGPHLNGLLVTFRGEIPSSSGVQSDQVAWRADKMRRLHRDFAEAARLIAYCEEEQRQALCKWAFLKDRMPEGAKQRLRTKEDVARFLHLNIEEFNRQIRRGYDVINAQLGLIIA